MFKKFRPTKEDQLKSVSNQVDFYQLQLISISGLPDGDAELKKKIVDKLKQKLNALLNHYNQLMDND